MADTGARLIITDEDLGSTSPATSAPSQIDVTVHSPGVNSQAPNGYGLPPVGVNAPPVAPRGIVGPIGPQFSVRSTLAASLIAAGAAMPAAWLLSELSAKPDPAATDLVAVAALWTGVTGLVFCALYSAWDDLASGLWEAAGRSALIGGAVGAAVGALSGAIAQWLVTAMLDDILRDATTSTDLLEMKLRMAYVIGWAVFGLGVGAACGAITRSNRKLLNSLVGGTLGGAVGGFAFTYIGEWLNDDLAVARLLSLLVIGLSIGAAIGLIEVARRQAWLKLVAGPMAGKELILYRDQAIVGSSPQAEITLIKDPTIAPQHARIDRHGDRRAVSAINGAPVAVNGAFVTSHRLTDGDIIGIGGSVLRYQERAGSP